VFAHGILTVSGVFVNEGRRLASFATIGNDAFVVPANPANKPRRGVIAATSAGEDAAMLSTPLLLYSLRIDGN
jgi:hypothetical protein